MDAYALNPEHEHCVLCGEVALGYARNGDMERLCHGDERLSCYHLWTVYGTRPDDA